MAKHRSHGSGIQAGNGKSITVDVPLPLLGVVLDTREAFHELSYPHRSRGSCGDDGGGPRSAVRSEGPASGESVGMAGWEHLEPGYARESSGGAGASSGAKPPG